MLPSKVCSARNRGFAVLLTLLYLTGFSESSSESNKPGIDELWRTLKIEDRSVVDIFTTEQRADSVELVCGICHVLFWRPMGHLVQQGDHLLPG